MSLVNRADTRKVIIIAAGLILVICLPLLIGEGWTSLVIEMLILAIAGCAANLLMGYGGMVHFGAAGPYAVGAYATALVLLKTGCPFGVGMIAGPVMAAVVFVPIGWFCVRRGGIYFALITLAFAQLIWAVVSKWYGFTGGDDGLIGIPVPALLASIRSYYYFTLIIAAVGFFLMWRAANSPLGKAIQAIRDNPERAEFVGIDVRWYQLIMFVISAFFLGLAGSLYVGFNTSIFPSNIDFLKTTDILVVCLLGGMERFYGPIMGAIAYLFLVKVILTYTEYWQIIMGFIVVLLVLFARRGIAGFLPERPSTAESAREE